MNKAATLIIASKPSKDLKEIKDNNIKKRSFKIRMKFKRKIVLVMCKNLLIDKQHINL